MIGAVREYSRVDRMQKGDRVLLELECSGKDFPKRQHLKGATHRKI